MWAFAGPACMGDRPTAVWLASLLADNGPDEIGGAIWQVGGLDPSSLPGAGAAVGRRRRRLAGLARGPGSPVSPDRQLRLRHGRASGQRCAPSRSGSWRRDKAKVFTAGVELPPSLHAEIEARVRRRAGRQNESAADIAAILVAAFATLAVKHRRVGKARAHRIDPARVASPVARADRRRANGRASVAMTPILGCGSAASSSPTGRDPSSSTPGWRMMRAFDTCLPTPLRAWPRCRQLRMAACGSLPRRPR